MWSNSSLPQAELRRRPRWCLSFIRLSVQCKQQHGQQADSVALRTASSMRSESYDVVIIPPSDHLLLSSVCQDEQVPITKDKHKPVYKSNNCKCSNSVDLCWPVLGRQQSTINESCLIWKWQPILTSTYKVTYYTKCSRTWTVHLAERHDTTARIADVITWWTQLYNWVVVISSSTPHNWSHCQVSTTTHRICWQLFTASHFYQYHSSFFHSQNVAGGTKTPKLLAFHFSLKLICEILIF